MKKYTISINDSVSESQHSSFHYKYRKMSVEVEVADTGFSISYTSGVSKSLDEIWLSDVAKDGTRKCLLAQLILYGQNPPFKIGAVRDDISGESQQFSSKVIHSLIDPKIKVDLSPIRNNQFISDYIMNNVQGNYETGIAAMFSYIYAKTKSKEEDRFTYLWRAFNGIYSSLAQEETYNGNTSWDLDREKSMIQYWILHSEFTKGSVAKLFNYTFKNSLSFDDINKKFRHFGYEIRGKISSSEWETSDVVSALDVPGNRNENLAELLDLKEYIHPGDKNKMYVEILPGNKQQANISLYGFLLAELAYQMRNDYFHARKPILLFSSANESNLRSLKLVNILLEHYLDHHIKSAVVNKLQLEEQKKKDKKQSN